MSGKARPKRLEMIDSIETFARVAAYNQSSKGLEHPESIRINKLLRKEKRALNKYILELERKQ